MVWAVVTICYVLVLSVFLFLSGCFVLDTNSFLYMELKKANKQSGKQKEFLHDEIAGIK